LFVAESGKTATKTATSPLSGGVIPLGAHPGNTGGKKGRSGRKPGPFKAMLAKIRESPELASSLERAIKDYESRSFAAALKVVTDYDDDKPAEKHAIVGPIEVRVKIVREGRRITAS
jgi:hypothetical protein